MRIIVLYVLIAGLAVYAWRNWFVSLCALVVLTALMGHPAMPHTLLGIQGMNVWNVLFVAVAIPWLVQRRAQGHSRDPPRWVATLLVLYIVVIIVAYIRAAIDIDSFPREVHEGEMGPTSVRSLTSDYLINSIKYLMPGVMLYDGCQTRRRAVSALIATLLMAFVCSAIIIRTIPISSLQVTGKAEMRQRRHIGKRLGFHANSAAMICISGFWGVASMFPLARRRSQMLLLAGTAGAMLLALALCRSRAGYVSFVGVGLLLGALCWRRLMIGLPIGVTVVLLLFPGIRERLWSGMDLIDVTGEVTQDTDVVTAGRLASIWPPVIEEIGKSPLVGHGRLAILRTEAYDKVIARMGAPAGHPHNAYLELALESGVIGFVPVMALYGTILWISVALLRVRTHPLSVAAGGASLAAVAALFIMGLSGQSFFPKENAQMAWCLYAIALRMHADHSRPIERVPALIRAAAQTPSAGRGGACHPSATGSRIRPRERALSCEVS